MIACKAVGQYTYNLLIKSISKIEKYQAFVVITVPYTFLRAKTFCVLKGGPRDLYPVNLSFNKLTKQRTVNNIS